MSMMVSFELSFFPRDVLDEILNLIESVSEDFPSYSWDHENQFQSNVVPAIQGKCLYNLNSRDSSPIYDTSAVVIFIFYFSDRRH